MEGIRETKTAKEYNDFSLGPILDIVMAAVQQNGLALEFAPPDLKADRQIVMAAVRHCPRYSDSLNALAKYTSAKRT
jgi:hypothetical protein